MIDIIKLWDYYAFKNGFLKYENIEIINDQENEILRSKFFVNKSEVVFSKEEYLEGMIKILKYMINSNAPSKNINQTLGHIMKELENTFEKSILQLCLNYVALLENNNEQNIRYFNVSLNNLSRYLIKTNSGLIENTFIKDIIEIIATFFSDFKEEIFINYIIQEDLEISIWETNYKNISENIDGEEELSYNLKFIEKNKDKFKKRTYLSYEIVLKTNFISSYIREKKYNLAIETIDKLKITYKNIWQNINNINKYGDLIDAYQITQEDLNVIINIFLWVDLQYTICKIKSILVEKDVSQLQTLFHFINDYKSQWKRLKINELSEKKDFLRYSYIIELSRLFLYKKIGKEQFDYLHNDSLYKLTIEDSYLRNFYNIVIGKFSLSYIKIGTTYNTKGYHLLLKRMFKNFWLGEGSEDLGEFIIPDEATNAGYLIDNSDNEEELIEMIQNEGNYIELKGTAFFDIKDTLQSNKSKFTKIGRFIKPIVSFLNVGHGGTIIIGIWEKEKVGEHIENGDFTINDIDKLGIKSYKSIHDHYIIGLEEIEKQTIDNLQQKINQNIKQYIHPEPTTKGDTIICEVKQLLGKKIIQITIPSSKNIYTMQDENNHKIIYIRESGQDTKISDTLKIVDFVKSKI